MSGVVMSVGEILVEVMREERGVALDVPGSFRGPFASGAPAIFAGAAARLGGRSRLVAVRGRDRFGSLCESRLRELGVDVGRLRTANDRMTGVAFVSYEQDGSREFLFHLPGSAAALLEPKDLSDELFEDVAWLHITGSSLAVSETSRRACWRAAELATGAGARVSFDPNLRLELMERDEIFDLCGPILEHAQVVLPSGSEASCLVGVDEPERACVKLLEAGAEEVVLKLGSDGSHVFTTGGSALVGSVEVNEVDPTGAGDCFAAAYAIARLEGRNPLEAARFANVAAALSVTAFGPMEGLPERVRVEELSAYGRQPPRRVRQ
jgi:sugar/nucleoside kinase (ribokinase family)